MFLELGTQHAPRLLGRALKSPLQIGVVLTALHSGAGLKKLSKQKGFLTAKISYTVKVIHANSNGMIFFALGV